jgi:hypothetical protein
MAERASPTLIGLAIAASVAVMPVLLAVLLVVASAREAEDALPAHGTERHVSVRHVAALKTFERAIVRRDRAAAPLPDADVLLARVPQCRADWDGRPRLTTRVRHALWGGRDTTLAPATRLALELDDIDQALVRFSTADNRRVTERVGLDGARWLDAVVAALATPVESPEYPGHRFRVQCADIAAAVDAVARSNGRMLAALAWRGTEVDRVVERWRPDQFVEISARQVARANPWSGLPGCVYIGASAQAGAQTYFVGGTRGMDERLVHA